MKTIQDLQTERAVLIEKLKGANGTEYDSTLQRIREIDAEFTAFRKYYKGLQSGSIYRTEPMQFSDGTPSLKLERWNWDFKNWSGHIANHEKTRKAIEEGIEIVEVSKEEALEITQA